MALLDELKKSLVDSVTNLPANVMKEAIKSTGSIIETAIKTTGDVVKATTQTIRTPKKNSNQSTPVSTVQKPLTIWEKIGCSSKTIEFLKMALADGMIDNQERDLLMRRIMEDGVDIQEFEFVLAKALETYHKNAKNVIKELSAAFSMAEAMTKKEEKANEEKLMNALPALMKSGTECGGNPYLIGAVVATQAIAGIISSFIKAPSKLNTFKAEIIRTIEIPLFPEVLVDFFGYASSQINEERQRNSGKGVFKEWSEALYGKDIDLVPIWTDKMTHVMTKTLMRYGNNPDVMRLVSKWRTSPLKKLMKITVPDAIEKFPMPHYASDYIDLLKYTYEMAQSVKTQNRDAYAFLNQRLCMEKHRFIQTHPMVSKTLDSCRIRPLMILMSNCADPVFMIQFETPKNLNDLLEVLNFLRSQKPLKKHYQRIYNEGLEVFSNQAEALAKIREFKPKNLLGL